MSTALEVVRRRFPDVFQALGEAAPPRAIERVGASLRVDGITLASAVDGEGEAQLQAGRVPAGAARATCYGLGMGWLPRVLLQRPGLQALDLVLLAPAADRAVLERMCMDDANWLADPRLAVHLARERSEPASPFALAPAALRLAEPAAWRLRDLVTMELAEPHLARQLDARQGLLERHLAANADRVAADGDARELFGQAMGRRIRVAGAGPSLSDRACALAVRSPGEPLLAVDAALLPLLAAGAVPEVVVTLDPHPLGPARCFEGDLGACRDSVLVYAPCVAPAALERWPGRRLAYWPNHARYAAWAARFPRASLWSAGSVLHAAVDLAVRMGAGELYLHGADFSFPGGRTHAESAAWNRPAPGSDAQPQVLDGRGQAVPSQANLIGYLRDLERFIAARPGVRFVNTSARGARIEGCVLEEDLRAA